MRAPATDGIASDQVLYLPCPVATAMIIEIKMPNDAAFTFRVIFPLRVEDCAISSRIVSPLYLSMRKIT